MQLLKYNAVTRTCRRVTKGRRPPSIVSGLPLHESIVSNVDSTATRAWNWEARTSQQRMLMPQNVTKRLARDLHRIRSSIFYPLADEWVYLAPKASLL